MAGMKEVMHRIKLTIIKEDGSMEKREVARSSRRAAVGYAAGYADRLQEKFPLCQVSFDCLEERVVTWVPASFTEVELAYLSGAKES